jgi:hypothetical protein
VFYAGLDLALRRIIGSQLVGDHDARRMPLFFQKLSHQTFGSLGIAAALLQHVENEAFVIDSPPQPVFFACNGDDDLIELPFVAKPTCGPAADFIRKVPTKFLRPKAHCLMGNDDPMRRQQIFDHSKAERKPQV